MDHVEYAVIGGGSAGYASASSAAAAGLQVAVVDGAAELGGLCILRGCMPSKTLIESARRFRALGRAGEFGLETGPIGRDVARIVARKRRLIRDFADYRVSQLGDGRFELIRGTAAFDDPHTVTISLRDGGKRTLQFDAALIATGSEAAVPPVPGLVDIGAWTSDEILESTELPESIIILGGGPVALEMAGYCNGLGIRTTLIQRSAWVLVASDPESADALVEAMRAEGVDVFTGTRIHAITREAGAVHVEFEHAGERVRVSASGVLNALGRRARLEGLAGSGVEIRDGRVGILPTQQTSQPHLFAAGDVCGPLEVVHIAIQQGELAARNAVKLLRGDRPMETLDLRLKLFAVFSEPEFAEIGATPAELDAAGIAHLSATYPFADHGKAIVHGETHGFVKLIAHRDTREILGASVVGAFASELIHEIAVAMRFRATAADLASVPHYHPTLSEIWTYPAEELAAAGD